MINTFYGPNKYLSLSKEFLIKGCKIPEYMLDKEGDCSTVWRENDSNGPPGYQKDYIQPKGWTEVGLTAKDLYDGGDNTWFGRQKKKENGILFIMVQEKLKMLKRLLFLI